MMSFSDGRKLNFTIIFLIILGLLSIAFLATGTLDPIQIGPPLWRKHPTNVNIPSETYLIQWVTKDLPDEPYSIRFNGAIQSGDDDIRYGITLDQGERLLTITLSPLGYLAIFERSKQPKTDQDVFLLDWQTWPHVNIGKETNEIWLDIEYSQINVRVNREQLWSGEMKGVVQAAGIFAENFSDGNSTIFYELESYPLNQ